MFSIVHIKRLYEEPEQSSYLLRQLESDEDYIYEKYIKALDMQTEASARLTSLSDREMVVEYNYHTIKAGLLESRLGVIGAARSLYRSLVGYSELPPNPSWQPMIAHHINTLIQYRKLATLLELTCWIQSCRRYTNNYSPDRSEHTYICFLIDKIVSFLDQDSSESLSSEDRLALSNALQGLRVYCDEWPDYSLPSGGSPKRLYREGSTDYQVFLGIMEYYSAVVDLTQKHFELIAKYHRGLLARMNPVSYVS